MNRDNPTIEGVTPPGPPHPYLTREETNDILETLNIPFRDAELVASDPLTLKKIEAIEKLIAGAIAEWVGIEFNSAEEETPEKVEAELQEWAEEYLVG